MDTKAWGLSIWKHLAAVSLKFACFRYKNPSYYRMNPRNDFINELTVRKALLTQLLPKKKWTIRNGLFLFFSEIGVSYSLDGYAWIKSFYFMSALFVSFRFI